MDEIPVEEPKKIRQRGFARLSPEWFRRRSDPNGVI